MRSDLKYFLYICDDCLFQNYFLNDGAARHFGWSVSCSRYLNFSLHSDRKYKRCWCSKCAVNHRRGRPRKSPSSFNA